MQYFIVLCLLLQSYNHFVQHKKQVKLELSIIGFKVMANSNKTMQFKEGDIVTIAPDYRNKENLDDGQSVFSVFYIHSFNDDGTIQLAGVWPAVPAEYVEGVPIESKLAKQICYVPNLQVRHYEIGKVKSQEDIYSRPPFMTALKEDLRNSLEWDEMKSKDFHFVHELQHWLEELFGHSNVEINAFYGKRKPVQLGQASKI